MARNNRRMLYSSISTSMQVNNLPLPAQLLFTWLISHADDDGRLKGDPKYIKVTVVPHTNWSPKKVKDYLDQMKNEGLIYYWQINNEWFIEFPKWKDFQYIQKDRYHESRLPSFSTKDVDGLYTDRIQNTSTSAPQSNEIESNQIETNSTNRDNVYSDIDSIKDEDLFDISQRCGVPVSLVEKEYTKMRGYCASSGMEYNNYKAALFQYVETTKKKGGNHDTISR